MTYQFKCHACGKEQEVKRSMKDSSIVHCPQCQSIMHQVYKAVGVHYKGNGFYQTDYKGGKK